MEHMNGDQIVAIRILTTGPDPYFHELCQIACVPLDYRLEQRKDVMPLQLNVRPEEPGRVDKEYCTMKKITPIMTDSHEMGKAADLFETWVSRLKLPYTKFNRRKKLMPLGHCFSQDYPFILRWLGHDLYNETFEMRYRDTETVALFLNEQASFHARRVDYSKTDLSWCCKQHEISRERSHDTLLDCRAIARLYQRQCQVGLL